MSFPSMAYEISNAYVEGASDDQILNVIFDEYVFETHSVEV